MGLVKVNLPGTFRCHLSPVFVNTQTCFNFMTLANHFKAENFEPRSNL